MFYKMKLSTDKVSKANLKIFKSTNIVQKTDQELSGNLKVTY